jgi:LPXTG-motif cell wall-anchored protein
MKPHQIIGVILLLAGVVCCWAESADKARSDWTLLIAGLVLLALGMWIGKFKFKKNQNGGTP